jgi:hypothetical protein
VPARGQVGDAFALLELAAQPGVVDRELPDDLLVNRHVAAQILVASPQLGELLLVVADAASAGLLGFDAALSSSSTRCR